MSDEELTDVDDYGALIRDGAESFMRDSDALGMARQFQTGDFAARRLDRTTWSEMAELGWFGLMAPVEAGGSGFGIREQLILHEEAGKALAPEPMALCAFFPMRAAMRCSSSAAGQLVQGIVSGEKIVTVAWQGKANAVDSGAVACRASVTGTGYLLSGTALYVPHTEMADAFLVAARGPDGVGLLLVPKDTRGVTIEPRRAADGSNMATMTFDNVELSGKDLVGRFGEGQRALDEALDETRLAICAEMLGLMQGCFQRTLEYMRMRKQFGRAIGSFQALQHRAVDLYVQVELARASLTRAGRVFSQTGDEAARAHAASAAKARISDSCLAVVKESIQLHGAIAYTEEYDIGLFLRKGLVLASVLGNSVAHRRRFGLLNLPYLAA